MSDAAHPIRLDRPGRRPVVRHDPRVPFLALLCALSVATVLYYGKLAVSAYVAHNGPVDAETDPTPVIVSVGPVAVSVPRNMIRDRKALRGSVAALDLRLHWPTMEGLSEKRAESFQVTDGRSPIIYATLRPNGGALAPQERQRLIYPRILDYPPTNGPSGLIATPFVDGHGYDNEILYTSGKETDPFSARCTPEDAGLPATCIVEFRAECGLDVTYRFRRHLLSRWRAIDAAMRSTVASFTQGRVSD